MRDMGADLASAYVPNCATPVLRQAWRAGRGSGCGSRSHVRALSHAPRFARPAFAAGVVMVGDARGELVLRTFPDVATPAYAASVAKPG